MNRFRLPRGRLGTPAGLPVGGYRPEAPPIPASSPAVTNGGVSPISTTFSNQYIQDDEFTDALAAGAVNGTNQTPGPGARSVVDTGSKLSLSGGAETYAGRTATNDPFSRGDAVTRAIGRKLFMQVTVPTAVRFNTGWTTSTTAISAGSCLLFRDTNLISLIDGALLPPLSVVWTNAVTYQVCVMLRAAGAYYFIKGGAFTSWTLLWIGTNSATATLYPARGVDSTAVSGVLVDYVRVPNDLGVIAPMMYDTFTRSNGVPGNSEGVGPDGQSTPIKLWTGATWSILTNAVINTPTPGADVISNGGFDSDTVWTKGTGWTIAGGVAVATDVSSSIAISQASTITVDVWYQCVFDATLTAGTGFSPRKGVTVAEPSKGAGVGNTWTFRADGTTSGVYARGGPVTGTVDNVSILPLTLSELFNAVVLSTVNVIWDSTVSALTSATQAGFVARLDSATTPANFIIGYFDGAGNIKLDECVAGVYTNLANVVKAFSASDTLRIKFIGAAWILYHTTAAGVTTVQATGTTSVLTGLLFGNFSTNIGNSVTSCQAYATGTDGEYNVMLNPFIV